LKAFAKKPMTTTQGTAANANTRGIFAMIGAMIGFTATDALMKVATATLPPSEIIVFRSLLGAIFLAAIMRTQGPLPEIAKMFHPRVFQRTLFEAVFIVTYVIALSLAPFALVFSVLQSAPIMITAFAALIWRDAVGWRRWSAVFLGFAGVALVIKPSLQGLPPAMALALVAALMVAGRDLTSRVIPASVPGLAVTFASLGGMAAGGLMLAPFETWVMPSPWVWLVLSLAGLSVAIGCYLVIFAYRTAETSAISPFRYASVAFAILIGWIVWGQVPDTLAMTGIALIVACGLYMMHRERVARRSPAK
jgi:drug/metabolite transporter (DMT)-like permease